jgi:putative transposase
MRTLDTSDTIELTDGSYQYVQHVNSTVRLRKLADGSYLDMHVAELTQRIVGLPPYAGASPRAIEQLPKTGSAATMSMSQHLNEIMTGTHPHRSEPDPRYDVSTTTQNDRIAAKVLELSAQQIPASRRTILRKLKSLREQGSAGLIDGRSLRQTAPLELLDERVLDALCSVLPKLKDRSSGTKARIIFETRMALLKKYGKDGPLMPADSSMYRYIDKLTIGTHATGSAKTRRSLADRPDGTFATRSQNLPGGEMQIDSTTLDVFIRTANGGTARPHLTILIDRATRSIVAYTFRLTATKGIDHAALLAQTLTPAQNRPDKSSWRLAVQRATPQISLLGPKERSALEATRPFIFPRTIVMDNGSDYAGHVFTAAAEKFGINIVLSAPHTPTGKPLVERTFHSINTLFTQYLPGYTGNSPENRGRDVEKDDLLSIHALAEYFDDFVLKGWNARPHGGLRDRLEPSVKLSPNQKFAEASKVTSAIILPLTADDYISMMPSAFRRISAIGIDIHSRQYDSPELRPYRGQLSNIPGENGKWEVKTDPYNPHIAWVRSRENTWIQLALRTERYDLLPHLESSITTENDRERNDTAAINAATFGTFVHQLAPTDLHEGPSTDKDTDTDTDTAELPSFDPDKD